MPMRATYTWLYVQVVWPLLAHVDVTSPSLKRPCELRIPEPSTIHADPLSVSCLSADDECTHAMPRSTKVGQKRSYRICRHAYILCVRKVVLVARPKVARRRSEQEELVRDRILVVASARPPYFGNLSMNLVCKKRSTRTSTTTGIIPLSRNEVVQLTSRVHVRCDVLAMRTAVVLLDRVSSYSRYETEGTHGDLPER